MDGYISYIDSKHYWIQVKNNIEVIITQRLHYKSGDVIDIIRSKKIG